MSRSPLAYPLNRSSDLDGGGAADLQTDIMRFMAILSLCLVAIFALVQSIPLTPTEVTPTEAGATELSSTRVEVGLPKEQSVVKATVDAEPPEPATKAAVEAPIVLTRPEWVPASRPEPTAPATASSAQPAPESAATLPGVTQPAAQPPVSPDGFILRFESDAALMRAVAAGHVGLYAVTDGRAQRMAVSNSRISFWDASTPNSFHEMESGTVPASVVSVLKRGDTDNNVRWGVTLPSKMKNQLDALMQSNSGGSLIIGADSRIRWEAS